MKGTNDMATEVGLEVENLKLADFHGVGQEGNKNYGLQESFWAQWILVRWNE